MNNESKVEKLLKYTAAKLGWSTRKWTSPGHVGVPDQIIIKPTTAKDEIERLSKLDPHTRVARIEFVEVKTTTGKLSSWQSREIARLEAAGCTVSVVYGEVDVMEYCNAK